jgi:hypothetical protein
LLQCGGYGKGLKVSAQPLTASMAWIKQRTAEPQNNEPQNFEGWFRFAQSFIYNRQNTFLRHSIFMIRYSLFYKLSKAEVSFSIKLAAFQAGGWAEMRVYSNRFRLRSTR